MAINHIKRWIVRIFLSYLLIGSVYYFSGYFYNLIIGKQNVFSPIIGLPLTILGWPWMVYADLIHHQSLGIKIPTVLTILVMIGLIVIFILKPVKRGNLN